MEYYDEYISLGSNCEIGFQFRRYGKEPSSLFSWLVSDIDKITNILQQDFKGFYEFEDLIPYAHNMVKSTKSGFSFHSRMHSKYNSKIKKMEFIHSIDKRREFFEKEKSKYNYLIEKWNNLSMSDLKVVYFIKDTFNYTDNQIIFLEQVIKNKFPKHNFKIVVVREGKRLPKESFSSNVDICYVDFFSDKKHPAVEIIDLDSWDKIYALYPLKNALPENLNWIKEQCDFTKKETYSLALNYNLAQFYEKMEFLDNAKYFLEQAKKLGNQESINCAYLRIMHKIESKRLSEELKNREHLSNLYHLQSAQEINEYIFENDILAWKYSSSPLEIKVFEEVRYLRLSLQEDIFFHLDEIEVWNIKDENIALNKEVMLSSTYKSSKPLNNKKVVNGIISGKSSFHTQKENNPWIVLDLNNYEQVKTLKIFNRQDKYFVRAITIRIETSRDLVNWNLLFDNFKFRREINDKLLTENQLLIIENIFSSKNVISKNSFNELKIDLKKILSDNFSSKDLNSSKLIQYTLLLKFKAYFQTKVYIKKSKKQEEELAIVNDAVLLSYGKEFSFNLENGLYKKEQEEKKINRKKIYKKDMLVDFLMKIDSYNQGSDEYNLIQYMVFAKYKAISRLTWELKSSKNKIHTNNLIQRSIDFLYGKGYVFTQHGIKKSINIVYDDEEKKDIVIGMNKLFLILKNKLNIDAYIVSGTLLGAVREGKFISYDDDFDSAYLSNEILFPNIWLETLQIIEVLPYKVTPIAKGLIHLRIVENGISFKLDLFTGWIQDSYLYRFPVPQGKVHISQIKPFQKINLYDIPIQVPNDVDAVLSNNYGKNWKTPDPTWRFDWPTANKNYKDSLISLKDENPSREWIFANIPLFLKEDFTLDKKIISIKTLSEKEIIETLISIVENTKNEQYIRFEKYFDKKSMEQYHAFLKFVELYSKYTIRYVGYSEESVIVRIKK